MLLLTAALDDADWVVRWSASRALGALGTDNQEIRRQSIAALASALKDGDSRVCEAAAFALEQMGSDAYEAVDALGTAATAVDAGFCEVIDAESEASQKILLATGWTVRWAAARALGVVGSGP